MKIFVDTSAFLALIIEEENVHQLIKEKYENYKSQKAKFFISEYILDELFTRLIYDHGNYITRTKVKQINQMIERKELTLLPIDTTTFQQSQTIFLKFSEHKISFTDATTYCLYQTHHLDEIFTLDSDFQKLHAKTSF